jgi:hypothetical protein
MAAPTSPQYPKQNPAFPQYWTNGRKDIGIYNPNYSPGRYFSPRDLNMIGSINAELMGDIIENVVQIFKIARMKQLLTFMVKVVAKRVKYFIQVSILQL